MYLVSFLDGKVKSISSFVRDRFGPNLQARSNSYRIQPHKKIKKYSLIENQVSCHCFGGVSQFMPFF